MSQQTIAHYKHSRAFPSAKRLEDLAKELDVEPAELLTLADDLPNLTRRFAHQRIIRNLGRMSIEHASHVADFSDLCAKWSEEVTEDMTRPPSHTR